MVRTVAILAILAAAACKREQSAPASTAGSAAASAAAETGGSAGVIDGLRAISVQVTGEGYTPSRIVGKPNEKLMLVFTRTVDASCVEQLKTPTGEVVDLPLNKPVKVAVTVPTTGDVGFACGMDMVRGVVVADPAR